MTNGWAKNRLVLQENGFSYQLYVWNPVLVRFSRRGKVEFYLNRDRHSPVDSSALSILLTRVRIPSSIFTLVRIIVKLYNLFIIVKRTQINKRRPCLAHFKKRLILNNIFDYKFSGVIASVSTWHSHRGIKKSLWNMNFDTKGDELK